MLKYFLSILMVTTKLVLFADMATGETLEKQIWADIKTQNWNAIESQIAPDFQGVHVDHIRDKDQEMAYLKSIKLNNYTLSNFKVTEGQDLLIITYSAVVKEKINNRYSSTRPAQRMSIWRKNKGAWQWIAHANFNPI